MRRRSAPGVTMSNPRFRLLLIDDDAELVELLTQYLGPEGFGVTGVPRGTEGVAAALSGAHELVLLDIMLGDIDGLEVLRRVRRESSIPVLMLTARGEDLDRIIGLELGADDYLPKPFNPRELSARIRAILRRSEQRKEAPPAGRGERLSAGDVEVDLGAREVKQNGTAVELTSVEFDLLVRLLRAAGRVVERGDLFRAVLDRDPDPLDRSIDMHISHLRKKLGHLHDGIERIKSIRGVGYQYTQVTREA